MKKKAIYLLLNKTMAVTRIHHGMSKYIVG